MPWRLGFIPVAFLLLAGSVVDDARKLQGIWKVIEAEEDGEKVPADDIKTLAVIFSGEAVQVNEGGKAQKKFTFKLDAGKSPRAIDFTYSEGPKKGMTDLGIYLLEGDHLKLCIRAQEGSRPSAFVSKPGSQHFLIVLRRVKS